MSKKKKSIMDGYFDEPSTAIEINPFVFETELEKKQDFCNVGFNTIENSSAMVLPRDTIQTLNMNSKLQKNDFMPLDSREISVRQALDKPLDSREIGVRQALDKKDMKLIGVRQALDKPLDSREIGVRQIENSALDVSVLVGKQKKLLSFIFVECKKIGDLETNFINSDDLKILLDQSAEDLRNLISELKKKGFFESIISKNSGRIGLRKFKISKNIYQQFLNSALDSREIGVRQPLDKPLDKPLDIAPYSSSNDFDKKNTITTCAEVLTIPENLRRFGISTVNLQNLINLGKATQEVIERSLGALSFDVENGKTGNLANIFFGVLGTGREYISQKYSETLQIELDSELARIKDTEEIEKKLQETKLQMKFKEYLEQNPEFIESVKNRHKTFVNSPSVLEKVAFEEFKALPEPI